MTPEKLKEIEARCEAASEGPWRRDEVFLERTSVFGPMPVQLVIVDKVQFQSDAAFIAHARTDVPDLIARVKELEGLNERLKQEAQSHAYEAKAQRATVHECNQAVTQGTGEPADWHGANPVKDELSRLRARVRELEERIASAKSGLVVQHENAFVDPEDVRATIAILDGCNVMVDEEVNRLRAENEKLRAFIEPMLSAALGGGDD